MAAAVFAVRTDSRYILFVSHCKERAEGAVDTMRIAVDQFPQLVAHRSIGSNRGRFAQEPDCLISAHSITGHFRGLIRHLDNGASIRPDFVVVDEPHSWDTHQNPAWKARVDKYLAELEAFNQAGILTLVR